MINESKLIALRVVIAIISVAIFQISAACAMVSIALFLLAIFIDMFDGILADQQGQPKAFGGFLDIAADQCIETLFWFLFLKLDLVPLWIPAFILVRNTFINLLRIAALSAGHTMFGYRGMLQSRFARTLVGSRFSRGIMVLAKTIGFVAAMMLGVQQKYGCDALAKLRFAPHLLNMTAVTALSILACIHVFRGVVLVLESRSLLRAFAWNPPVSGTLKPMEERG